jgi:hypothetical protein
MKVAPPCGKACSNQERMWETQPNQGLHLTASSLRSCVAAASGGGSPPAFGLRASRLPIRQNPRHVLSSEWLVQCVNRGDGHGQTRQSHR